MYISHFENPMFTNALEKRNGTSPLDSIAVAELYLQHQVFNRIIEAPNEIILTETQLETFLSSNNLISAYYRLKINVIWVESILGKAQNGNQLDGLTFNYEDQYVIIINKNSWCKFRELYLHELVHIAVDICIDKNVEHNQDHIEQQVEYYVNQIMDGNYGFIKKNL